MAVTQISIMWMCVVAVVQCVLVGKKQISVSIVYVRITSRVLDVLLSFHAQ